MNNPTFSSPDPSLSPGETVEAVVERTEVYGIYLKCGGVPILVLIPELEWIPTVSSAKDFVNVGERLRVRLQRWDQDNGLWLGSVKEVEPQANPWNSPELRVGHRFRARVVNALRGESDVITAYLIEVLPGVLGRLQRTIDLQVGAVVVVEILDVNPAEKRLELQSVRLDENSA